MKRPDLLVTQPLHLDFPWFRHFIRHNREYFSRVLIAFSDHGHPPDLSPIIRELVRVDSVECLGPFGTQSNIDWRHLAVTEMLQKASSDSVLFFEQDFLISDPREFLPRALAADGVIGFREGNRLHPSFILIDRSLLDSLGPVDYGTNVPHWDHFGHLTHLLEQVGAQITELESLGLEEGKDWQHLAGTCQGYTQVMAGERPHYKPESFAEYNKALLNLGIEQIPFFLGVIEAASKL